MPVNLGDDISPGFVIKTVYRYNMNAAFGEKFVGIAYDISGLQKVVSHYAVADIHNLYIMAPAEDFSLDAGNTMIHKTVI